MINKTEEGQKVARNNGDKYWAVFQKKWADVPDMIPVIMITRLPCLRRPRRWPSHPAVLSITLSFILCARWCRRPYRAE